ncbi:MAG: alanine--glyoxylate aminotransferase family protein [Candidatus Melainabacteria bacterium]
MANADPKANPKATLKLMIPGPTPLPDSVREALGRPAIGHRSPEFKAILNRVLPRLQWAFQTKNDVLLFTASGTAAAEAAIINTLNPGDTVLVLVCGVFSARWGEVAKSLGMQVETIEVPPGQANTVASLKARLDADTAKTIKMVAVTHSETSTGVQNPVAEMTALIKAHGALSLVDAVTSLGAAEFRTDDWGVDLAFSGSQKGFMIPPGLSFLTVSERAWQAHKAVKNPGFYFNFTRYKKAQDDFTTPYTPATALIIALDEALAMMEAEGLEAITARHALLRNMVRAGVGALGLKTVVNQHTEASYAVTSVTPPDGVTVDALRKGLKNDFGILVADGQKELKGRIFRIGHLGHVFPTDVLATLAALEQTLYRLGYTQAKPGAAVAAAQEVALSLTPATP